MKKDIWYTARNVFGPGTEDWEKYLAWSGLTHLQEVISLDRLLNGSTFKPDYNSQDDWHFIITDGGYITNFYTSPAFVLDKVEGQSYFNFIAAVKEPDEQKNTVLGTDFEFIGYELLDKEYGISVLTNCGGFDEIFQPKDINEYGLVTDYTLARQIQQAVFINNPTLPHADCYLLEVWRHRTIGRK